MLYPVRAVRFDCCNPVLVTLSKFPDVPFIFV